MHRRILYATLVAGVTAASAAPAPAFAGVMPIAGKAAVAPSTGIDHVDWRPFPHRHHRWHMGWYFGRGPGYGRTVYGFAPRRVIYGYAPRRVIYGYAPRRAIYGFAPRRAVYGFGGPAVYGAAAPMAAPGCGVYGAAAVPNCCGTYGYAGDGGLFGLGFGGGGLLGLGLGPL